MIHSTHAVDPGTHLPTLAPHHPRGPGDVHHRLHRPHEHLPGPPPHRPRPAPRPPASRQRSRHLLLGLPGPPNSRRPPSQALEPQKIHQRSTDSLGHLRSRLRFRPYLPRNARPTPPTRSLRKRRLSRHPDLALPLVRSRRTCPRQRPMATVPPRSRRNLLPILRVGLRPLELALHANRRRCPPIPLANRLAASHSRSAPTSQMAPGGRTRNGSSQTAPGNDRSRIGRSRLLPPRPTPTPSLPTSRGLFLLRKWPNGPPRSEE